MADIRITIEGHGQFQTTAEAFDLVMSRYLPASTASLRTLVNERMHQAHGLDYSDLHTATECLMVLAELDGFATN